MPLYHDYRKAILAVYFALVGCVLLQAQNSAIIRVSHAKISQVVDGKSALAYINKELVLVDNINTNTYADGENLEHNSFINDINHPSGIELYISITGVYKYTTITGANKQVRRLTYVTITPQPQPEVKYKGNVVSEKRLDRLLKDHLQFIYKSPSGRLFNVFNLRTQKKDGERVGVLCLDKSIIEKWDLSPANSDDFINYINYGGELYTVEESEKKIKCDTCNGEGRLPHEKGQLGRKICPECKGKKGTTQTDFKVKTM